jgi:hypothetical protein
MINLVDQGEAGLDMFDQLVKPTCTGKSTTIDYR